MRNSVIKTLKEINLNPSKKLGQNFLIDNKYKNRIIECLNINNDDTILEIGPGLGALTDLIFSNSNNFLCVELDKKIFSFLKEKYKNSFPIINNDFLKLDFNKLCNEYKINKVVSNLPYSVSSKIILKIIQQKEINLSILMIQKELCSRIISKPKSKEYNNFSVLIQMFCNVKKEFDIPNSCFFPKPSIISSVIKLTPKIDNYDIDFKDIQKFLQICFQQKRKTLINNLKNKFDINLIKRILNKISYNLDVRPEHISVEDYKKIFLFLNGNKND